MLNFEVWNAIPAFVTKLLVIKIMFLIDIKEMFFLKFVYYPPHLNNVAKLLLLVPFDNAILFVTTNNSVNPALFEVV